MALTVYTSKDNQWREHVNPLRGLTLEWIVSLIEQSERGAFADFQWFCQAVERSDALIATVLACEQAAFLRDQYDRVENLREVVAFLASATFRGVAHVEKHYAEGGRGVVRLEPVDPGASGHPPEWPAA
ncbi:MAG: hypothetical protein GX565_05145 [Lentisphaerae bacterium]|jgi:hypothetical protein|nr:hypothetical protein [Lentisphaerota bacterium]